MQDDYRFTEEWKQKGFMISKNLQRINCRNHTRKLQKRIFLQRIKSLHKSCPGSKKVRGDTQVLNDMEGEELTIASRPFG